RHLSPSTLEFRNHPIFILAIGQRLGESMKKVISVLFLLIALGLLSTTVLADSDLDKRVEHGYADSNGVKIHYASLGKGQLIILNLPHPRGLNRELAHNPQQQKNSQYARNFQLPDAHTKLTAEQLCFWVKDPEARKKYVEAFKRSDFEAMLNYYKRNYPREPYTEDDSPVTKAQMPVLMIHGLNDIYLLAGALNNTWDWLDKDLTLLTIPGAGHFVQQDA